MQMDDNLGTQQLNVLPKKLCANVLKIWQRLAVAGAVLEIFERKKEKVVDVEANALDAYKRHVAIVLSKYKDEIPLCLTESLMLANTVDWKKKRNKAVTFLSGHQLWNSIWLPLQRYIANVMLPIWMEVRPVTKSGVVRSGIENWEPVLLELRTKLFNSEKNSICLLEENKGTEEQSDDEDEGERDQVVNSNHSTKSAKKSKSSPNPTKESAAPTSTPSAEGGLGTSGTSTFVSNNGLGEHDKGGAVEKESDSSKRGRKSREPGKMIAFDPNWFPLAWLAFREYGPLGETPNETWKSLVTPKDKPIDVDGEGNLVIVHGTEKKVTNDQSLGRQSQRKKARADLKAHPKNMKPISLDSDEDDDKSQLNSILTEFSTIRKNLVHSDGIQDFDATTRRSQLRMDLIAKMNLSEEQKQLEYKKIWDSLG